MFSKETYIRRRARLQQLVGEGVIILMGNNESPMIDFYRSSQVFSESECKGTTFF